jgi:phosphoglycolate phosphatase
MIGDTPHDAETARAMGADCILYSGGHAGRDSLLAMGVPVVDDLRDVLKLIL